MTRYTLPFAHRRSARASRAQALAQTARPGPGLAGGRRPRRGDRQARAGSGVGDDRGRVARDDTARGAAARGRGDDRGADGAWQSGAAGRRDQDDGLLAAARPRVDQRPIARHAATSSATRSKCASTTSTSSAASSTPPARRARRRCPDSASTSRIAPTAEREALRLAVQDAMARAKAIAAGAQRDARPDPARSKSGIEGAPRPDADTCGTNHAAAAGAGADARSRRAMSSIRAQVTLTVAIE